MENAYILIYEEKISTAKALVPLLEDPEAGQWSGPAEALTALSKSGGRHFAISQWSVVR